MLSHQHKSLMPRAASLTPEFISILFSGAMIRSIIILFLLLATSGCGTTKWSDTARTGTEQLLISYAIDRTVERIDFSVLHGKKVYVKTDAINDATDHKYLSTAIRQQIAICGGLVCDKIEDSEYVVELRTGAVGTDRNDLLFGIPAVTLPEFSISGNVAGGTTIPEIPFVKKTDQRAVCKLAVFAYHRETGRPLWCSGNRQSEGRAKAWWVFGAGPLNRGDIYDGTEFAGDRMPIVFEGSQFPEGEHLPPLVEERYFLRSPLAKNDDSTGNTNLDDSDADTNQKTAENRTGENKTAEKPAEKTPDAPVPNNTAPVPGNETQRIATPSRYGGDLY